MFIDTHCHLTARYQSANAAAEIIARANAAGVGAIVVACAEPGDGADAIKMCEQYDNVYCTIGFHPDAAPAVPDYEQFLSNPKCVGVGEIGLDYHELPCDKNAQIAMFRAQMEIAAVAELPVAIHTRNAEADTFDVLCNYDVRGVMHCYSSGWELATKMLDRGFYFAAGGMITFRNADDVRDVFRRLPLDRIVLETDAPWLAPVPYRGRPCEPAMLPDTAHVLANIRGLDLSELESIIYENTKQLYPKLDI